MSPLLCGLMPWVNRTGNNWDNCSTLLNGVCALSIRKDSFGNATSRHWGWLAALALITCGESARAQLVTIEKSVELSDVEKSSDAAGTKRPNVETTTGDEFTATDPQQLFAENIVYVQPPEENSPELEIPLLPDANFPPAVEDPYELPTVPPAVSAGCAEESIHDLKTLDDAGERLSFGRLMREPYSVYRSEQSTIAWLTAHGEHFGWLDWQSDPFLRRGNKHGLTGSINVHWLSGPGSSPLPPRLYDFVLGYQVRNKFSDQFSYDLFTSIGAYGDFEDSARDGVRFPSHAVGMFHVNHATDVVFGVDYLDRDDIAVLPVVGVSLRDVFVKGLRMDLVFPRPRVDYMLSDTHRMYLAGIMNGGTWAVEFPNETNQVMTYRDLRLLVGFESADKDGSLSAWELGWVFGRRLEFRDVPGDSHFNDAFVIQWVTRR